MYNFVFLSCLPFQKEEEEWDEFYESENQRELRQIWQGQSQIFEHIRELSRKMDEVIGRQENTLSLVSRGLGAAAGGVVQQPPAAGGAAQQPPMVGVGGTMSRAEIDLMVANQNNLLATARELRSLIGDIHARTDSILQQQQRAPSGQVQSAGYDVQAIINEMRDGMNQVKQGITHVGQK